MKVLALASYPIEAAASRYRLFQFIEPLQEFGIDLEVRPYLTSKQFGAFYSNSRVAGSALDLARATVSRVADVPPIYKADVILVQREAMIFGPPFFEWLSAKAASRPIVLDLDDATYVPYVSPTYGRFAGYLKWFKKTDQLIDWSAYVICGNRFIAEYVEKRGARARIIPTVVDTEVFMPGQNEVGGSYPVLGWIGTHSTYPFLESIFPALEEVASRHKFKLRIVGSGRAQVRIPGVEVENVDWALGREVRDFQSFDIGLYPIDVTQHGVDWTMGKSGFKAIQYMAVGIPFIVTPVGVCAEMGTVGTTHLNASTHAEWVESLERLILDRALRCQMGRAAREYVVRNFNFAEQARRLGEVLKAAASGGPGYS